MGPNAFLNSKAMHDQRCLHAQVKDFVDRYMPAYTAYLPQLYKKGPERKALDRALIIEIDEGRGLIALQPEPLE